MTSPSPSMDPDCRTFYRVKMFHSDVAICIDRVLSSHPADKKMRELFSLASSCLWLTSRSLAKLQSVHCLTTYVRTALPLAWQRLWPNHPVHASERTPSLPPSTH